MANIRPPQLRSFGGLGMTQNRHRNGHLILYYEIIHILWDVWRDSTLLTSAENHIKLWNTKAFVSGRSRNIGKR